jgi:hypothetical protein
VHSHRWATGWRLLDRAPDDRLRSFALGYLCHLAADTVAHNVYVPRRLVLTSSTRNVGHAYWEARFDACVAPEQLEAARELVSGDHAAPDALLEDVLTWALFTFRTNKRIYRGILGVAQDDLWRAAFGRVAAQSRWPLPQAEVDRYLDLLRPWLADFLVRGSASLACRLDPVGRESLALAKRVRRRTLREVRVESGLLDLPARRRSLATVADILFPVPAPPGPPTAGTAAAESGAFWERFAPMPAERESPAA